MARRQSGQWGISFRTVRYTGGYDWKLRNTRGEHQRGEVTLQFALDPFEHPGEGVIFERGLQRARSAFNAFVSLARNLNATDDEQEQQALIKAFANEYGMLWGHDHSKTARDWCKESADFMNLHGISAAVCSGDFRQLEKLVLTWRRENASEPDDGMSYASVWRHSPSGPQIARNRLTLAEQQTPSFYSVTSIFPMPDLDWRQKSEIVSARNELQIARLATPRGRAMMALSNEVSIKLDGGLSFRADPANETLLTIENSTLVHLLYLRLWMDTIGRDVDRLTHCLQCNKELEGTRRKKFCGDPCRTEFHNRRRRVS